MDEFELFSRIANARSDYYQHDCIPQRAELTGNEGSPECQITSDLRRAKSVSRRTTKVCKRQRSFHVTEHKETNSSDGSKMKIQAEIQSTNMEESVSANVSEPKSYCPDETKPFFQNRNLSRPQSTRWNRFQKDLSHPHSLVDDEHSCFDAAIPGGNFRRNKPTLFSGNSELADEVNANFNWKDNTSQTTIKQTVAAISEPSLVRVRSFKRTPKGVISKGDAFRELPRSNEYKSTSTNASPHSSPSFNTPKQQSRTGSNNHGHPIHCQENFQVFVLGADEVGKTTLCHNFHRSECCGGPDTDSDTDCEHLTNSVMVEVDGVETKLTIIDSKEWSTDYNKLTEERAAFMIVYAIDDRNSFQYAKTILSQLRASEQCQQVALLLVANKCDLVRRREVNPEDGKSLAENYDCKFLQVSTIIDHKVDDLLVSIVISIRDKLKQKVKYPHSSGQTIPSNNKIPSTIGFSQSSNSPSKMEKGSPQKDGQNKPRRGFSRFLIKHLCKSFDNVHT